MARHGKRYNKIVKELGAQPGEMEMEAALRFIKEHPAAEFDESVDIAFRLGCDPTKSDQAIRGTVTLPHGTGKDVRVVVFAHGEAAEAATAAGATEVGYEELIAKVKGGWLEFDVAIATPDAMKEVRMLGKVLGPRGLMPNPKTGTVTDDTASAVQQFKAGRVEYRMDRHGNVIVPFGKRSFEVGALKENCIRVIEALKAAKPAAARGTYFRRCTVSSTMGPGLQINIKEWAV